MRSDAGGSGGRMPGRGPSLSRCRPEHRHGRSASGFNRWCWSGIGAIPFRISRASDEWYPAMIPNPTNLALHGTRSHSRDDRPRRARCGARIDRDLPRHDRDRHPGAPRSNLEWHLLDDETLADDRRTRDPVAAAQPTARPDDAIHQRPAVAGFRRPLGPASVGSPSRHRQRRAARFPVREPPKAEKSKSEQSVESCPTRGTSV